MRIAEMYMAVQRTYKIPPRVEYTPEGATEPVVVADPVGVVVKYLHSQRYNALGLRELPKELLVEVGNNGTKIKVPIPLEKRL